MSIAALGLGCKSGVHNSSGRKALVLGFDGMDYSIVGEMMARGELPNFSRVAGGGGATRRGL